MLIVDCHLLVGNQQLTFMQQMSERTILVVDDEISTRMLLQKFFEKTGYTVLTAKNGREGLEKAVTTSPDIIMSDVIMPEMDGYEFCQRLKQSPETNSIPVILLTARGDTESAIQGFQAGADDYISKPFDVKEVRARVERVCRWVQQKRENSSKISGRLEKTPLFELLHFCEEHRISGIIHLMKPAKEGSQLVKFEAKIHLQLGEITTIQLRDVMDVTEALDELLEWEDGTFTVEQEDLQLPKDESNLVKEDAQGSEPAMEIRLSHQLTGPLQQILEEFKAESVELDNAVITDIYGTMVSAVNSPTTSTSSTSINNLIAKTLKFSEHVNQEVDLGALDEAIILSETGLMLLYPIENLGAMGVTTLKENQGMVRWNCREVVEKIAEFLKNIATF